MIIKELKELKHISISNRLNYLLIPVSVFDINREGAEKFNKIFLWLKKRKIGKLERTPSGAIKLGPHKDWPAWDYRTTKACVEITVVLLEGAWRIQFRAQPKNKMSGRKAFTLFKRFMLKKGIDLDEYVIDNGPEVKNTIEKPLIGASCNLFYDHTFEGVNHIDFHNSYAGGLANTHPEFREALLELYEKRKTKEEYKDIMNFSIGFMQSLGGCGARWAHLSRDAIKDNNERVKNLSKRLEKSGRIVLSYNTDGIWYKGPVFHGSGEGPSMGEWSNDHLNCKFRIKSSGAYEFIENNLYKPVIRGIPNSSKKEWKWGDIYTEKAESDFFYFDEGRGIVLNE